MFELPKHCLTPAFDFHWDVVLRRFDGRFFVRLLKYSNFRLCIHNKVVTSIDQKFNVTKESNLKKGEIIWTKVKNVKKGELKK